MPSFPDLLLEILRDPGNTLFVSIASFWEMSIKSSLGKLQLAAPLEQYLEQAESLNIQLSPISRSAVLKLQSLPFHHRDPFDRILIATAQCEEMQILSADGYFGLYEGLRLYW